MKKKLVFGSIVVILAIIFGPVVFTQVAAAEERTYQRVYLADVEYSEVSFRNETQDLDLAGMLFVPDGDGPFPAVVIIHGSKASRRDSNWYLTLSSYMQKNGVAVLLPDKRGCEKSEGDWYRSSLEDLATDTLAAIDFMKSQEIVEVSQLGIIGMSQGGVIAPVVASQSSDLDFVINMVGHSVTMHEQLIHDENFVAREMGLLPGISNMYSYVATFVYENFTAKEWWEAVGNFTPLPYWQKVNIPALVLLGSEDHNVPSEESKARIEALDKDNIRVIMYEGSGHGLEDPPGTGDHYIRQEALSDMLNFILTAVKR
ncbi:MAG TPA: alpha/beta fold hydrolase [Anaerolineales bacterium]|nr:alpha/beta fold hydrolase [Anaerolineales bacterium]